MDLLGKSARAEALVRVVNREVPELSRCKDVKLDECTDAKLGRCTDAEILQATEQLASGVRKINAEFLRYLREVEGRRLYLALGYPSLYEYCVKALKLSEGSASRRIGAMRIIRDLPQSGGGEVCHE